MGETSLLRQVQVALVKAGARMFRNQTGTYELKDGRFLTSGLAPGSSDLIGWVKIKVTPEMVGKELAIFTACEVKTQGGRMRENQLDFLRVVNESGGVAFVARTVDEALSNLRGQISE